MGKKRVEKRRQEETHLQKNVDGEERTGGGKIGLQQPPVLSKRKFKIYDEFQKISTKGAFLVWNSVQGIFAFNKCELLNAKSL